MQVEEWLMDHLQSLSISSRWRCKLRVTTSVVPKRRLTMRVDSLPWDTNKAGTSQEVKAGNPSRGLPYPSFLPTSPSMFSVWETWENFHCCVLRKLSLLPLGFCRRLTEPLGALPTCCNARLSHIILLWELRVVILPPSSWGTQIILSGWWPVGRVGLEPRPVSGSGLVVLITVGFLCRHP